MLKLFHSIVALFFLTAFQLANADTAPTFQLVETTPVKTIYQNSTLSNTETVWLNMVNEAQRSIVIGSFFFASAPNSSMEYFVQALNAAAERGVQVQILLDQSMQAQSAPVVAELNKKNIGVRYVNFKQLDNGVMHAKYMIIDGHDSFVGSQNFGWKAISQNHELGIRIDNVQLANNLLQLFNIDWQLSQLNNFSAARDWARAHDFTNPITHENPIQMGTASIYPAYSPKDFIPDNVDWDLPQLLDLIDGAKQQILIQVYQYSDLSGYQGRNRWQPIDKTLIDAAKRGVKIKLLVSDAMLNGKAGLRGLQGIQNIPNIEIRVSSIPVYQGKHGAYPRVDHAKYMLIDNNITWISTSNWQKNYFYKTRGISLVIHDSATNAALQKIFWQAWQSPYAKTPAQMQAPSKWFGGLFNDD